MGLRDRCVEAVSERLRAGGLRAIEAARMTAGRRRISSVWIKPDDGQEWCRGCGHLLVEHDEFGCRCPDMPPDEVLGMKVDWEAGTVELCPCRLAWFG